MCSSTISRSTVWAMILRSHRKAITSSGIASDHICDVMKLKYLWCQSFRNIRWILVIGINIIWMNGFVLEHHVHAISETTVTIVIFIFWRIENSRTCSRISVIWMVIQLVTLRTPNPAVYVASFFFLPFPFHDVDDCISFRSGTNHATTPAFLDMYVVCVRSSSASPPRSWSSLSSSSSTSSSISSAFVPENLYNIQNITNLGVSR